LDIRAKAHDVVNVAAPLKRRQLAARELLAFEEQSDYPQELVADVSAAVFNFKLSSAVFK